MKINSNTSTGREEQSAYCEQIHDSVTGLSKKGFSEANAEQWTRIDCKTKRLVIDESTIEMCVATKMFPVI